MKHETKRDGLFMASANDERWSGQHGFFDTREEAITDGRQRLSGKRFFTGCVHLLSSDEVAQAFVRDGREADEHLIQQDEWSWCDDLLVYEPPKAAADELHAFVKAWVERHGLYDASRYRVDDIEPTEPT